MCYHAERANDHTVSEFSNYIRVSMWIVQCICDEWCVSGGHETQRRIVVGKMS